MFKLDDYAIKVKALERTFIESKEQVGLNGSIAELAEKKELLQDPEIWQNLDKSVKLSREIALLEERIAMFVKIENCIQDMYVLLQCIEESEDIEFIEELEKSCKDIEIALEEITVTNLLKGKYDTANAILSLHAGAGGTESCDWVAMLYRMYTRYAERNNFKVQELERLAGDEAGIKSVTFKVEGIYSYGYFKAEKGVHRLVRISPFDANKRRHTSFASLEVLPEIDDDTDIVIRPEDIKVSTFRSSGAGGQHVNKTESAIRIQHLATGIVVTCQNERSQIQNREMAMKLLKSRLVELQESQKLQERQEMQGEMKKIEWGSQIRSYVFCPYTLVKDHRTGFENANIQAVMDGDLQPFILEYLKKS